MVFLTTELKVSDYLYITSGEKYYTYLICGNDDLAIVDANYAEAIPRIVSNIRSFGFQPTQIRWIFVTEYHEDHVGGLPELLRQAPSTRIATSSFNAKALEDPRWRFRDLSGISDQQEVVSKYGSDALLPLKVNSILSDGDRIKIGDLEFDALLAPGHSPEELCLYESSSKMLVCSDAFGIYWPESGTSIPLPFHSLNEYKRSMKRLSTMKSETLLTGHNGVVKDADVERFVQSGLEAADEWEEYIVRELSMPVRTGELAEKIYHRFPACRAWNYDLTEAVVEAYLQGLERAGIAQTSGADSWRTARS